MAVDLEKLTTEQRNPMTTNLDLMTPQELVEVMNTQDAHAVQAVRAVLPQVAQAVTWATETLRSGGRIVYFGAGTSGRLGVLDAVECPPTFGVDPGVVVGLIAGGERAFVRAVEGAEDSLTLCREELTALNLNKHDIAIGLAASGRTPYVLGGLAYAKEVGCKTVAISCNAGSPIGKAADLAIEPVTGPEVLSGSTRLKAGTAQKLILNMISTGSMVGIGKAYHNLMVDVQQTNQKLVARAQKITMEATGCTLDVANQALAEANGHVKCAIVMILAGVSAAEAQGLLAKGEGHVRRALTFE